MAELPLALPSDPCTPSTTIAGDEPGTSSKEASSASMRELMNAKFPAPRKLCFDECTTGELSAASILQEHARQLLDAFPEETGKRLRRKSAISTRALLESALRDPDSEVLPEGVDWDEWRRASSFLAAAHAVHLGISVRRARLQTKDLWRHASPGVRQHAWLLSKRVGMPVPATKSSTSPLEKAIEGAGFIITWQTGWGRSSDVVGKMFSAKADPADILEVAKAAPLLRQYFDDFCDFVASMSERAGLEVYGVSLELNTADAETNRVHVHAFVCRHWKQWRQSDWERRSLFASEWSFNDVKPYVVPTTMKANANPLRPLTSGLYYVLAPKIGSVFRRSNLTVWKDPLCEMFA